MSQSQFTAKQLSPGIISDALVAAGANIALSKIAGGTSLVKNDGSVPFTAVVAGIDPTLPAHLATKNYVDSIAVGLDVKASVRVATTANIALTGTQTIDGIAVIAGDRVLVKNQTTATQNGIYIVAAGAWARSSDADNSITGEVTAGLHTFVEQGTINATSGWVLATANPIVLGTTSLAFAQFSGSGTYSAGNGLTLTGSQFNVISANGGISSTAGQIALTLADSTLSVGSTGLKLAALTSGNILVGNGTNVATGVALSGDATITNAGALTIAALAITTAKLAALSVTTAKLALNAVDETILKQTAAGTVFVGQGSGTNVIAQAISGDATLAATGALTIAAGAVSTAKLANNSVDVTKLAQIASGSLLVGQGASNVVAQALSGDATLAATGALTIAALAITTGKLAANAVDLSKMAQQAAGTLIVGQGAGTNSLAVALSGDATITAAGVITIANNAVTTAKLAGASVTTAKLALNAIDETVTKQQATGAILIGQGASNVVAHTLSGDATMDNTGAVTLNANVLRTTRFVRSETPAGTVDGVNVTYTLANTPVVGTEMVFVNGQLQDAGAGNDYTISGTAITMLYVLSGTDKIRVSYWK
jgi:hypothetical protein